MILVDLPSFMMTLKHSSTCLGGSSSNSSSLQADNKADFPQPSGPVRTTLTSTDSPTILFDDILNMTNSTQFNTKTKNIL